MAFGQNVQRLAGLRNEVINSFAIYMSCNLVDLVIGFFINTHRIRSFLISVKICFILIKITFLLFCVISDTVHS